MARSIFRYTVLSAALSLFGLTHPACAQNGDTTAVYFPNNATIKGVVSGTARVGYATTGDFKNLTHPTSPTVSLVKGGSLRRQLTVRNHSTVDMSGGSVAESVVSVETSTINISGGSVGKDVIAFDNSTINVRGGSIQGGFQARFSGTINLYGTGLKAARVKADAILTTATGTSGPYTLYTLSGKLSDGANLSGKTLYVEEARGAKFALHNAATLAPRP